MDFAIAQAAVTLLAPYFAQAANAFASKAGEATWDAATRVYRMVGAKFSGDADDYAQQTLDRLAAEPENRARQEALAHILVEKSQSDPAFAAQLEGLVRGAVQNQSVNQFMTRVEGNAWVGVINNIGPSTAGRDVNIRVGGRSAFDVLAEAGAGTKALLVLGVTLFLAGFVSFGYYVVSFILSIFTALASDDQFKEPEIPNPLPWLPLGVGLLALGMIITVMSGVFTVLGRRDGRG